MSASDAVSSRRPQPPVGIDLGTTLSVVAYIDATGRPVTVPNRFGDLLTPSAVAFEDDLVIVGKEAVKGSILSPETYADCFKRDMGRTVYHRPVVNQKIPPEVFSAFLLQRLKEDAQQRIGPIHKVVITVPAFFDEGRRKATQDAGYLAGLEVLDIINEPTAAAVTFGYHRTVLGDMGGPAQGVERLLVYDLGGGTFDVTILEIDGSTFRTVATDGDVQLGGHDFDERLVNHAAETFLAEHGLDPRSDPRDATQLWLDVQDAKHALSERRKTSLVCHHHGIRMRLEITREQFEDLMQDLVARTESTTSLVLRQAGLQWSAIDRVLLVGGATRMPMVGEMLRRLSGKEPDRTLSPDEAVAHGAALYAAMLMAKGEPSPQTKMELINVNSHSLGVVGVQSSTGQRRNVTLIPKNTPLPTRMVRQFQTARANQSTVNVPIVEGESPRPEHCISLGQCVVRDLPPGLPRGTPVEVTYEYAANGRLSVTARVPSIRQSAHVEIERKQTGAERELDAWRQQLFGLDTGVEVPAASDTLPKDADRTSVLKRLDALYIQAGARAALLDVPPKLQKSQQVARTAAEELHRAEQSLQRVSAAVAANPNEREARQLAGEVARSKLALQNAKTKSRFAHLVLGRECVDADFTPPELAHHVPEILELRKRLES